MFKFIDIQINRALYLIKKAENILIICHRKPDADTIGSALALGDILEKQNKKIEYACQDQIPSKFFFLKNADKIKKIDEILKNFINYKLLITLDCGSFEQTGLHNFFSINEFKTPIINIDHHHDNPHYGKLNIIEANASSTSEIVHNFLLKMNVDLDKNISTSLLNGIFGDTDSFKNPNTSHDTLKTTSDLLASGANLKEITKNTLQDKSLSTLRLWGKILSDIKKNKKLGIVYAVITKKDLQECNAKSEDLEGIANFLNSIPDVKASLVLSENEKGEIKGSFRTLHDHIDVSKLARSLGGGGHKKAAGFTLPGRLIKEDNEIKINLE
ncbi:MAG: bifunctional oligoribonuclease/PAP phosphatase NrnA [Patescibacteria group bacterium]|jgi:phosphoesterase RecJ-like protein